MVDMLKFGGVNLTNEVMKAILERRSIRKYKPDSLARADIETILSAGINAPNGADTEPWHFTRSTKNHAYPSDIWIEYSLTATLSASENILEILLDIDPRKHLLSSPEENITETIFQILDDAAELPYFESNPTKLKAWIRETLPNLKPGEKIGPMDAPKSELIVGPAKYELSIWRSPEKETSHIIRLHIIKSAP